MVDMITAAQRLRERCFAIVWLRPGDKRPKGAKWTHKSQAPEDYTDGSNLGLLCGRLSQDLVCVDLDSAEAIRLAAEYLPPTGMVDGRPGKPRSHFWYRVTDISLTMTAPANVAGGIGGPRIRHLKHAVTGKGIIDFLGTGSHAVVPPSHHKSGEIRVWYDTNGQPVAEPGEPAVLPMADLWTAVLKLAEACGWKEKCPAPKAGPRKKKTTKPPPNPKPPPPGTQEAAPHLDTDLAWQLTPMQVRIGRCRRYLLHCDPAIAGQGGHDQTYRVARTIVNDFAVGDPTAAWELLAEYNQTCQPPWDADELRHKLDAALQAPPDPSRPKGCKLVGHSFANCETVIKGTGDDAKEVKVPLPSVRMAAELNAFTEGWPKRIGSQLFAPDHDKKPLWLVDTSQLFAWIGQQLGMTDRNSIFWVNNAPGFVSEAKFLAHLQQKVEQYDAIETYPHEPSVPGVFYMHPAPQTGGAWLPQLLDRFNPASEVDRDLLKALFLSVVWGGPAGQRPAWLITSDEDDLPGGRGRGTGKSTLANMVVRLVGGAISVQANDDFDAVKKRLLSPDAQSVRVALLDNVKTFRLSLADLEGLITAPVVSGHKMYVGEGRRPNLLTWLITLNGASLSTDLAQRCICVRVKRPAYTPTWDAETRDLIERQRWAIIGELLDELRQAKPLPAGAKTRWPAWEQAVLGCVRDPVGCVSELLERQAAVDDDAYEADLVRDEFLMLLKTHKVDAAEEVIWFSSAVAAELMCRALGDRMAISRACSKLNGLGIRELRKSNRGHGHGFIWHGTRAPRNKQARKLGEMVNG